MKITLLSGHHRQYQSRWMLSIVINRIGRRDEMLCSRGLFPGIQVAIKAWEIAAGDFQAKHVSLLKDIAGCPEIEIEFVNLAWVEQGRFLVGVAVTRADDSFGQVLRETVGPDVYQLSGEVRVHC